MYVSVLKCVTCHNEVEGIHNIYVYIANDNIAVDQVSGMQWKGGARGARIPQLQRKGAELLQ